MKKILDVIATTPLGDYPAKLQLDIDKTDLSGILSIAGFDHSFSGGSLVGEDISLAMKVKTPMGAVSFKASGKLKDDILDCSTKTRLGFFRLRSK